MVTLTALVAFMLITPGFCLAVGMRAGSKHNFYYETQNPTTHLISLITLTTIIQLLAIPGYVWMLKDMGTPFVQYYTSSKYFLLYGPNFYWKNWFILVGYIFFVYIISFGVGYKLIQKIETGRFFPALFHGPLHKFVTNTQSPPICSVVTKINHDGCYVMYKGVLRHVIYESRHQIKYIILSKVEKFTLNLHKRELATSDETSDVSYTKSSSEELLYIDGNEIFNILISPNYGGIEIEQDITDRELEAKISLLEQGKT